MSAPNSRPSGSSPGKNSSVQSQSSSSCQDGSISCRRFIRRDPLISTIQNSSPKLAIHKPSRCLNPALISASPHYGLRYGSIPATGNFQRLTRSTASCKSFKVVYAPFFHGGNTPVVCCRRSY